MKIAVVGSRGVNSVDIGKYIDEKCIEIVSGGAKGVDECAEIYANEKGLKLTVFKPEYKKYGRYAPLARNRTIVDYSDEVLVFWDGNSKGSKYVIDYCEQVNKKCRIVVVSTEACQKQT